MKEWKSYVGSREKISGKGEKQPNWFEYLMIKLVDNALAASVIFLTLFFAIIGLFCVDPMGKDKINWALDCSKLCLGVLLGLLANRKQ